MRRSLWTKQSWKAAQGRYSFCWRGSVEKHMESVREKVFQLTGLKKRQALQHYLEQQAESIPFVHGKGKHKSEEQRRWEELDTLCKRWEEYEHSLFRKCFCCGISACSP